MVGAGVLSGVSGGDDRVRDMLVIGRRTSGVRHPTIRELVRADLMHYDDVRASLAGRDACLNGLGASAVGMDEGSARHVPGWTRDINAVAGTEVGWLGGFPDPVYHR
jgi:hypothetical protein